MPRMLISSTGRLYRYHPSSRADMGELKLGPQDLIRVAGYAQDRGHKVAQIDVGDDRLQPMPLIPGLTALLREHGSEELEAAMREEYAGLYVTSVRIWGLGTIARDGIAHTEPRPRGNRDMGEFLQDAVVSLQLGEGVLV